MAHAQCVCHAPPMPRESSHQLFAQVLVAQVLVAKVLAALKEWRRRAQGRRELAALNDRCLRDIGLTRYDANREVRKPFWRA